MPLQLLLLAHSPSSSNASFSFSQFLTTEPANSESDSCETGELPWFLGFVDMLPSVLLWESWVFDDGGDHGGGGATAVAVSSVVGANAHTVVSDIVTGALWSIWRRYVPILELEADPLQVRRCCETLRRLVLIILTPHLQQCCHCYVFCVFVLVRLVCCNINCFSGSYRKDMAILWSRLFLYS